MAVARGPGRLTDDVVRAMRAGGMRVGAKREALVRELAASTVPVSAEALAARVPGLHESSVYRTLTALEERGLAHHVHLGDRVAGWQLGAPGRAWLVCQQCGSTLQIGPAVEESLAQVALPRGFVWDLSHSALPGRCRACQGRSRTRHSHV